MRGELVSQQNHRQQSMCRRSVLLAWTISSTRYVYIDKLVPQQVAWHVSTHNLLGIHEYAYWPGAAQMILRILNDLLTSLDRFKVVSKILNYWWKKTNSNWIMIRLKLFDSHHLLSTQPGNIHRQSVSEILMLSLLESSATSSSRSKAIFQWSNTSSSEHVRLQLYWLPLEHRIKYKLACLCYQTITGNCPSVLGWTCPDLCPF